jgi:diguanylate cyclase (GGDEF)-like protein/PAS domain S-box-containing protein
MGYPLIVVFSGLAEKQRGLIVSTALILLSLVWLIYGEMSGWFAGHPFLPITWLDLLINAVIIVLVAVEVNMLVVNWNDRLAQTSRELVERRQIEQALSQSREMYRLLAENISDVIWVFDVNENRTRYISPSVERLRGYTAEEVLAGDMSKALTPASLRDVLEKISLRIKAFHEGCRGSYVDELEQLCKDGSTVWTEVTTRFHLNEDNGHVEMYGVSRGISERKRSEKLLLEANEQLRMRVEEIELLQAELREQIIRDPMTGLYNRRYMNDLFIREFSRAARENYALSVIMLDMDDLKMINDTYGHHIGDAAIQALASCLKSLTRIADVACRYGGDEFTIVMAKTSTEDAVRRIEEWREFLSARPVEVDAAHRVAVKFTAGIASFPTHGTSMEEIINYADIALYRAKARGRDCTAVFE